MQKYYHVKIDTWVALSGVGKKYNKNQWLEDQIKNKSIQHREGDEWNKFRYYFVMLDGL